jgi:hypothetical protein
MADYMSPVHAILQQVNTAEPSTTVNKISVHMYVGGIGVACFLTLALLSPSIVVSETEDGLTKFSVGKALLFSVAIMVIAYYALK